MSDLSFAHEIPISRCFVQMRKNWFLFCGWNSFHLGIFPRNFSSARVKDTGSHLLMFVAWISRPVWWQSMSMTWWWFMTSEGCTSPPRWFCRGSWCAIGPPWWWISAITIWILFSFFFLIYLLSFSHENHFFWDIFASIFGFQLSFMRFSINNFFVSR